MSLEESREQENPMHQKTEQETLFEKIESYRTHLAIRRAESIKSHTETSFLRQSTTALVDTLNEAEKKYAHIDDPHFREIIDTRIASARAAVAHYLETNEEVEVTAKKSQEALDDVEEECDQLEKVWRQSLH